MIVALALSTALAADVDPFRPAGSLASGEGTLQGETPFVLGEGLGLGIFGSYAQDLAVNQSTDQAIVRSALPLEFYGAWTFADRGIRIEAFAPLYATLGTPGNPGVSFGDIRLQANLAMPLGTESFGVSLLPRLEIPTGSRADLVGRGAQAGFTTAVAGRLPLGFGLLGNAGVTISPKQTDSNVTSSSTFDALLGATWSANESFRIGAEIDAHVQLADTEVTRAATSTWHAFAQTRLPSGIGLTVGGGTGVIAGVGAPDFRIFSALTYQLTVRDQDGDGIVDREDACPTEPEDVDGFEDVDGCPELDNDQDTLADLVDACPNDPEDLDGFTDEDGCPDPDNDNDGFLDPDDRCPLVPGTLEGCPDTDNDGLLDSDDACPEVFGPIELQGCPDRDGDRVPDFRDACPDQPIQPEVDPATSDGCPKLAVLIGDQITIYDTVYFETGRAVVAEKSMGLLQAVADVIAENPGIKTLEVAGHTDSDGSASYNRTLSDKRAKAVLAVLISKGVDKARLQAKGYGEDAPITTNATDNGKARNRRVEFNVTRQDVKLVPVAPETVVPQPSGVSPWDTPSTDASPWDTPTTPGTLKTGGVVNPWQAPTPDAADPSATPAPGPAPVSPAPGPKAVESPWTTPTPAPVPSTSPWGQPATPEPVITPTPVAPKPVPPPIAPRPAATPEAVTNPWGAPTTAPEAPWGSPAPSPSTDTPWPAPTSTPAPTAVPTTDPTPIVEPAQLPETSGTVDPMGLPGRLTIVLNAPYTKATVYIDNEPLPRQAPFSRYPVIAGDHKIWIQSDGTSLDHEVDLRFTNDGEQVIVLPPGSEGPSEERTLPSSERERRSRKDRRR